MIRCHPHKAKEGRSAFSEVEKKRQAEFNKAISILKSIDIKEFEIRELQDITTKAVSNLFREKVERDGIESAVKSMIEI